MAVKDIEKNSVNAAIAEFSRLRQRAMLAKYGGGGSRRWYLKVDGCHYDQKLVIRAAHVNQGLGALAPAGSERFHADEAKRQLEKLGYRVVPTISPTVENLKGRTATAALARWLIGAAKQRSSIPYAQVASRLERECGFGAVFPPLRVGETARALQYALQEVEPRAPLLNVLVVRGDTGEPSGGAGEFLAPRFPEEPLLAEKDVDKAHPEIWSRYVARACEEVYQYRDWEGLYERLYGPYEADPFYAAPVERDGLPRGPGGEGENHRSLRLWVTEHPECLGARYRGASTVTEHELLSGDRVDVVCFSESELVVVEVKSRDSNWQDLRRGVYQCVKYRAVLCAQEASQREVRCVLVTESQFPTDLAHLANGLDIEHRCVNVHGR